MLEMTKKFGSTAKEVAIRKTKATARAVTSICETINKYRLAAEEFALCHKKAANRIIGFSYFAGDALLAFTPLVDNGFMYSLIERQPRMDLLSQGLGGRPLPA